MNKKGGYQIIDLKDFNFTEDSLEFDLTHEEYFNEGKIFFENIFGENKKPLLITNIVIDGVEKNDVMINDYVVDNIGATNQVNFNMYNKQFAIYHDDVVCYFTFIV